MEDEQGRTRGSSFGIVGPALLICGVTLSLYAFAGYETSVATYGVDGFDRVNNTGLMQRQMMIFTAGCFTSIAGVLCVCAGAVLEKLGR